MLDNSRKCNRKSSGDLDKWMNLGSSGNLQMFANMQPRSLVGKQEYRVTKPKVFWEFHLDSKEESDWCTWVHCVCIHVYTQ